MITEKIYMALESAMSFRRCVMKKDLESTISLSALTSNEYLIKSIATEQQKKTAGYRLLATGCFSGYWLQVTGYWLLPMQMHR